MKKLLTILVIIAIKISSINSQLTGESVQCSLNRIDCSGCGANGFFTYLNDNNCRVTDCNVNPYNNLNGWMCLSCYNIGVGPFQGKYLQGNFCVNSCQQDYTPDTNYICQPQYGFEVGCGYEGACIGCGITTVAQNQFQSFSGSCRVFNCSQNPFQLNGWMCKSCSGVKVAHQIYSDGQFLQETACVSHCYSGFYPDENYICQKKIAVAGSDVACSTLNTCTGCTNFAIAQALFTFSSSISGCRVTDCSLDPSNLLNGWMCKSCNGVLNAHQAYSAGKFLQGSNCVFSCYPGYFADENFICQQKPIVAGSDVSCNTVNTCTGCANFSTTQALFTFSSSSSGFRVTDCSLDPSSNLNGWMCKSCNGVLNAHQAYSSGKFLQGSNCVYSCYSGYFADKNFICQKKPIVAGQDVACGTVSKTGVYTSNCNRCGVNSNIQGLFTISINPNCKVIDCSQNPGSNLNGWMCKSCKGVTSAHSVYSAGKLLSGTACVAFCPKGQSADQNNECKAFLSSKLLKLAFTILLLNLLI